MGLKVRKKKKSLTFLSLKVQKCIMIFFLEFVFGFMDILHINKQGKKLLFKTNILQELKKKTRIKKEVNLRQKTI
jgi:hypothetical protein